MKLTQKEIEQKLLHAITNHDGAIELLEEHGVEEYHFLTKEPGDSVSINGKIYTMCKNYAKKSGGYKVTETIFNGLLIEKGVPQNLQDKFYNVWCIIQNEDTSVDDVPFLIQKIKDKYCVEMQSEMIQKITDHVKNDQVKESVSVITEYVHKMAEEQDEFKGLKKSFDMSLAKEFFWKEFDERVANPNLSKGITCGIPELDNITLGWFPSQLILLLAPTGGGKSIHLLNWADHAHRVCKKNVVYFSFEMEAWLCKLRHVALVTETPYRELKSLTINEETRKKIDRDFEELDNGKYFEYVEAIHDPTPEFVEQKIRELTLSKGKPEFIVVDYIGNMKSRNSNKSAKHWEKNGDAYEGLHKIALDYKIPIATAQQFNRESIKETRKRKEDGKTALYQQDAAAGDQRITHLSTYILGIEPIREENICWVHPVKVREDAIKPFSARIIPEYNKVIPMTENQQSVLSVLSSTKSAISAEEKSFSSYESEVEVDLSGWADSLDF